jgi:hypothetical protein
VGRPMNLDDRFYQGITAYQRMVGNAGPQSNSAPAPGPRTGTSDEAGDEVRGRSREPWSGPAPEWSG